MLLPEIDLPLQVPEWTILVTYLMHPSVVHFAIVLPVVILLVELINLFTQRKSLSVSVYVLYTLLVMVFISAYITGVTDGREAAPLLSDQGAEALKAHKLIGVYLVYLVLFTVALKVMSLMIGKGWGRALYSLSLIGLIASTFYQGKEGGELVYTYGANVASLQELDERVEALTLELEALQAEYGLTKEVNATSADANSSLGETTDGNASTMEINTTILEAAAAPVVTTIDTNGSTEQNRTKIAVKKEENNSSK